jgi:hypothetical protein
MNYETIESILQDAKKKLDGKNKHELHDMAFCAELSQKTHDMDLRLSHSLFRAFALVDNEQLLKAYKGERRGYIAIPKWFIFETSNDGGVSTLDIDNVFTGSAVSTKYLRQAIGLNTNVEDVFTNYFCDQEEMFLAQQKAGSKNYFRTVENGVEKPGYREFIHPEKRKAIDYAVALYLVSDEDGVLHFDSWHTSPQPKPAGQSAGLSSGKDSLLKR